MLLHSTFTSIVSTPATCKLRCGPAPEGPPAPCGENEHVATKEVEGAAPLGEETVTGKYCRGDDCTSEAKCPSGELLDLT